jgi:hypothetical protein
MGYEQLVAEARRLLTDAIAARYRGDLHVNKVKQQAYADGYLRALGDAGLLSQRELLELVTETRVALEAMPADTRVAAAG